MPAAHVCFYLKCQDLATSDIQTYIFYQQDDLLAFARAAAEHKWAILNTDIRFLKLNNWYARLPADKRDLKQFSPDDYEHAVDGKAYLSDYQSRLSSK